MKKALRESTYTGRAFRHPQGWYSLRAELFGIYGPSCPLLAELSTGRVVRESSQLWNSFVWLRRIFFRTDNFTDICTYDIKLSDSNQPWNCSRLLVCRWDICRRKLRIVENAVFYISSHRFWHIELTFVFDDVLMSCFCRWRFINMSQF